MLRIVITRIFQCLKPIQFLGTLRQPQISKNDKPFTPGATVPSTEGGRSRGSKRQTFKQYSTVDHKSNGCLPYPMMFTVLHPSFRPSYHGTRESTSSSVLLPARVHFGLLRADSPLPPSPTDKPRPPRCPTTAVHHRRWPRGMSYAPPNRTALPNV